ncbi:hypothetical protein [Bartonella senegalensis]|uniref:hypothetical protein n=1 Tax=Bartonella senegalensis TaxID=1468418 RepID=UPI0012B5FD23|nr:hypothetical protein [Bartonella senegalensis]
MSWRVRNVSFFVVRVFMAWRFSGKTAGSLLRCLLMHFGALVLRRHLTLLPILSLNIVCAEDDA